MYDSRCLDLANVFLEDEPTLAQYDQELAQAIQDAIEDWIAIAKEPEERGT
jgi:hypothetical protein